MDPIIIAVVAVLVQYPIAVFTLIKLFRADFAKSGMWVWNFAVILIPYLGAAAFWIFYAVRLARKKKSAPLTETAPSAPANEAAAPAPSASIGESVISEATPAQTSPEAESSAVEAAPANAETAPAPNASLTESPAENSPVTETEINPANAKSTPAPSAEPTVQRDKASD